MDYAFFLIAVIHGIRLSEEIMTANIINFSLKRESDLLQQITETFIDIY